jgi:hypothetical protein
MTPPAVTAERNASNVQLDALPVPTTVVGCETSAAIARAGNDALVHEPSGFPVGPIVLPVMLPESEPPGPESEPAPPEDELPHAVHARKIAIRLIRRLYNVTSLDRRDSSRGPRRRNC